MKREKVIDKRTSRSCPWSRREELALVRAWSDVVRRPAATRATDMDADDELFVEFQQALAQCDDGSSTVGGASLPTRTKAGARAKVNRIVFSVKCIQEHLQQQQLLRGNLRAAARARENWFTLSKEQQFGNLKKARPEAMKSSFCSIDRDVFELLEPILQDERPVISHVPERHDPRAKWTAIEIRYLVHAWREELKANPTVHPNATSMFQRFSELTTENTRRRSIGFMRKLKQILKTYTEFLDSEQSESTGETPYAHAKDRHAAGLPARFRSFTERQGQMRQPLLMNDDTIDALGEIKRMLDAVETPNREFHHVPVHDSDGSSDDDSSGIQRYRIKKGAHDEIDLVELQSCSSESGDDARCWKRHRPCQFPSPQQDLKVDHAAASASQGSVATTVSIYSAEDSPRIDDADDEVKMVAIVGSTGLGSETGDFSRISAITSNCAEGVNAQQLSPVRAVRSGMLPSSVLDSPELYHHQTQHPMLSFKQAAAKRNNGQDECMTMPQRFREESRRGRDEIINEIHRIELKQQKAQANILRTLESLGQELRAQRR